jgi:hypothetical protein
MNENLLIHYTPLQIEDNQCIIHKDWFNKQSSILQNDLMNNLLIIANEFSKEIINHIIKIDTFNIPSLHIPHITKLNNTHPIYFAFLKIYKRQFIFDNFIHLFNGYHQMNNCVEHQDYILFENNLNYKHYGEIYECSKCNNYYIFPNCTIIYLDDNMLESLIGLHIKANKKMTDDKLNLIPLSLKETIQSVLNIYQDDGAFIKTSLKSAKKNNKGIKTIPCFTINDVFENLVSSDQIMQSLLFGCNLIIRRWMEVNVNNEFRVYVLDKQIKAICQQSLSEHIIEKKDKIVIIDIINNYFTKIVDDISYNDCVIDLFIDNKDSVHLIEINSGGPWSTACSGLFSWNEIMNATDILFRYL